MNTNDKEPKTKIFCPYCFKETKEEYSELAIIECDNCKEKFKVVKCKLCKLPIYFKKEMHGFYLDNCNIQCPYKFCNKIFYQSQCPKCLTIHKFPEKVDQTTKITCDHCNRVYIKIKCPIKGCELYHNIENDSEEQNSYFPTGIKLKHFRKIIRIIICPFCKRSIYFQSPYRYLEGQKVTCPYEDCKKSFHRLICPQKDCRTINIVNNYEIGEKIMCSNPNCMKCFSKIVCPYCLNENVFVKKNEFGGFYVKCKTQGCLMNFTIINCSYCKRANVFVGKPLKPGSSIQCAYPNCGKIFSKVTCPGCKNFNILKLPFPIGKSVKCSYQNCNTFFKVNLCATCEAFRFSKKISPYGSQLICQKCNNSFLNFNCPFCHVNVIEKNSGLKEMQLMECPNCHKDFSMTICSECKNPIYSQENSYIENMPIKCKDCHLELVSLNCPNCSCLIALNGKKIRFQSGQTTTCNSCKKSFSPVESAAKTMQLGVYKGNMQIIPIQKGFCCCFGIESKSENSVDINDFLIQTPFYNQLCKNIEMTIKSVDDPDVPMEDGTHSNSSNSTIQIHLSVNQTGNNININLKTNTNRDIEMKDNTEDTKNNPPSVSGDSSQSTQVSNFIIPNRELDFPKKESRHESILINEETYQKNAEIMDYLCPCCQFGLKEAVFLPCGHRCLCYFCAEKILDSSKKCYKCHQTVERIIKKVYE